MQTNELILEVDRHEIAYIRMTIESYDGMAVVTTLDPHKAIIQLRIAPGCRDLIMDLLNSLKTHEKLKIEHRADWAKPFAEFREQ